MRKNHPLSIIKSKIVSFFSENQDKWSKLENIKVNEFKIFEDLPQIVSTKECFDNLLVDEDNETRSPKNTYYVDNERILRTHMTAFDIPLIKQGNRAFISVGDVFRRDTIDRTHYPIFHQIDAVRLFSVDELIQNPYNSKENNPTDILKEDLKYCLENLIRYIIGNDIEMRWNSDYFPFTDPSFENEIFYNNDWLEVLGCGVLRDGVIKNAGLGNMKPKKNRSR